MTNADKLRSMTDKELAEWLAPRMLCSDCPLTATGDNIRKCMSLQCDQGALEFLQQEATDAEQKPSAHWILADNGEAYCSECHCEGEPYMCYCPMCGKKMGGGA